MAGPWSGFGCGLVLYIQKQLGDIWDFSLILLAEDKPALKGKIHCAFRKQQLGSSVTLISLKYLIAPPPWGRGRAVPTRAK